MQGNRIIIVDLGGTHAVSAAKRLRSNRIFCEIVPVTAPVNTILAKEPKGIILAGGDDLPEEAVSLDIALFGTGVPVLAAGYSARRMAEALGGRCTGTSIDQTTARIRFDVSALFEGLAESDRYFDRVDEIELPEGFAGIATASDCAVAAFADEEKRLFGIQFYAESNDPDGLTILQNFACAICQCEPWWTMETFISRRTEQLRREIGAGRVMLAISGGTDSTVCAALLARAIGEQLTCLFVDTGLLRKGEVELVEQMYREQLSIRIVRVDARERFLLALTNVESPADKRRIIEEELHRIMLEQATALGGTDYFADGSIYMDILGGSAATEDEGGVPRIFPLRYLFKSEVREAGELLGVPQDWTHRQSFPGPGLAIRIIGEVTQKKLDMLREADAIFCQEVADAGLDRRISQYFAVLTEARTRGLRGGPDGTETAICLRAVSFTDSSRANAYRMPFDLLERVSERIIDEVDGVNRVLYDITRRSAATAEWE